MSVAERVLAAYGAGGFGREVLELGEVIDRRNGPRWKEFIFIDDSESVPDTVDGYSVYNYQRALEKYGKALDVIIAVGEPCVRRKLMEKLQADQVEMPVLINPDSFVSRTAVIGKGSVIRYGASVFCGAVIGENVCINPHANIGHDSVIGDGSMISAFCNIAGGVKIGSYTYIGMSAVVRELAGVGDGSVVSMGCVIRKDIPAHALAIGEPIKLIHIDDNFKIFGRAKAE